MNGLWDRTPMWVQVVFLTLFALFGQGCGARTIGRASGTVVDAARLHRSAQQPVEHATPAEREAYMTSFVLTAINSGGCTEHDNLTIEAAFNACLDEVLRTSVRRHITLACTAGCADRALQRTCIEQSLPSLSTGHANGDRSVFGQTYTCAQAVELVMREHSLDLAELNQRRVREDERAQVQLANLRRERDAALAARQGGEAPTAPTDPAPLAEAPPDVNRDDAARHADATHGRRHRVGRHRALRNNRPATRDATARRVRERRERSDYVTLAEAQQIATRAVADALHQLNVCAGIGMRDAQAGIATCMTRVNGYTVVAQALVANQCPSVDPSNTNAMLTCGQQIADRLADRADAGVPPRARMTPPPSTNPPQASVMSPPRGAPSSSADPPPHAATDQSLRKGVKYGVIGLVLLIGVLGLLRILLPGTSGPGG